MDMPKEGLKSSGVPSAKMNTVGLADLFESTSLTHYSIACLVQHTFGKRYRCQSVRGHDHWCFLGDDEQWYDDPSAYHALRTALSAELVPFLHGHIAGLIRTQTHESELIDRLQILEMMLQDAPQKDWILKECKSMMYLSPPTALPGPVVIPDPTLVVDNSAASYAFYI